MTLAPKANSTRISLRAFEVVVVGRVRWQRHQKGAARRIRDRAAVRELAARLGGDLPHHLNTGVAAGVLEPALSGGAAASDLAAGGKVICSPPCIFP